MRCDSNLNTFTTRCGHRHRHRQHVETHRHTFSDSVRGRRHGLELHLLLVQSQRSCCCWVAPYTSPYRRVFSNTCLELIIKSPVRSLLCSVLIHCPLVVCNQHIRIAQMMTMTWIKSEFIVTSLLFKRSSAFRPPHAAPAAAVFTTDYAAATAAPTVVRAIILRGVSMLKDAATAGPPADDHAAPSGGGGAG